MSQPEHATEANAGQAASFRPGAYVVRARLDLDSLTTSSCRTTFVGIVFAESLKQLACLLVNSDHEASHFEYSPMQAGDGVLVSLVYESAGAATGVVEHASSYLVRPVSMEDDFADQDVGITTAMSRIYQTDCRRWLPIPEDLVLEESQAHWTLPSTDEAAARQLLSFDRMLQAHALMTPAEKAAFATWESRFVIGDGAFGTTDWPGWSAVIARLSN